MTDEEWQWAYRPKWVEWGNRPMSILDRVYIDEQSCHAGPYALRTKLTLGLMPEGAGPIIDRRDVTTYTDWSDGRNPDLEDGDEELSEAAALYHEHMRRVILAKIDMKSRLRALNNG